MEDQPYLIWIEADGGQVELRHRDPRLIAHVTRDPGGRSLYGSLEFKSAAGYSDFEVWQSGRHLVSFTVEVFPSKVDYKTDFRSMLAEVQSVSTALALDLLASTYLPASSQRRSGRPSANEWVLLVEAVLDELNLAFREIERAPIWTLDHEQLDIRPESVRRPSNGLRNRLVSRGLISSETNGVRLSGDRLVRSQVVSPKLDGPEHRWLRQKLTSVIRRLSSIAAPLASGEQISDRANATQHHFKSLAERLRPLLNVEPIKNATGSVSASFASLKLMSKPGYSEAYRLLGILDRGLNLEGDAVKADLRDIATLYEYWCFLSLVRLASELLDRPPAEQNVVKLGSRGIRVDLERGRASTVRFRRDDGLTVELAYNRKFTSSAAVLFDQVPDVLVSIRDARSPEMHLVVDAKYRVDKSLGSERFGMIAPPADAINALYRYRDAIVRETNTRSVVEAVAAFPASAMESEGYRGSRLSIAIDEFGVGAIPFLPGNEVHMRSWLQRGIGRAAWETASSLPGHVAVEFTERERRLAEQIVLIDVIPSRDRSERLEFFMGGLHYVPLPMTTDLQTSKAQRRRLQTNAVALFGGREIELIGDVVDVSVVRREEIKTPYVSSLASDRLCVLYRLENCRPLTRAVEVGNPFTSLRWTSGLALDLAKSTNELLIELADEWKLYRALLARPHVVRLRAEAYREQQTGGHVAFEFGSTRIRLDANRVWRVRKGESEFTLPTLEQVLQSTA